jgi:uncharacterized protein (UPF0333 family)
METKQSSLPLVLMGIVIGILVVVGYFLMKKSPEVANETSNTTQTPVDSSLHVSAEGELKAISEDYADPDFDSLDKGL